MAFLSRKKRYFLVKVFGLMSIIRWPNVVFTAFAQYVAAIYVFTPNKGHWDVLKDLELHLIVAATAFIIAAGFIINSFYDFEKDLINRPHKTLFNRVVSKEFCLKTYFVLNFIGLTLSLLASYRVLIFFSAFAFGLWFYSHKLQKFPVVREITASILSVLSVFSIVLYYQHFNFIMVLYGMLFMGILLNREIVKNIKNLEGDKAVGNDSISTRWGVGNSKLIFSLVSAVIIGMSFAYTYFSSDPYALVFSIIISATTVVAGLFLIGNVNQKKLFWSHQLYKVLMVISVLYWMVY